MNILNISLLFVASFQTLRSLDQHEDLSIKSVLSVYTLFDMLSIGVTKVVLQTFSQAVSH
jgi:hypothetical protein